MVVDRATQRVCLIASSRRHGHRGSRGKDAGELLRSSSTRQRLTDAEADDRRAPDRDSRSEPSAGANDAPGLYRAFDATDGFARGDQSADHRGRWTRDRARRQAQLRLDALFRHPEIVEMRDLDEEDPAEIEASKFDLSYIALDGDIDASSTAPARDGDDDTIKLFGASPANFLDVGGGATTEKVTEAFKIMLANPKVKGILVNIFGGIMRVHDRQRIVAAAHERGSPCHSSCG